MGGDDDGVVRIMMLSSMVDWSYSMVSVMVLGCSMVHSGDVVVHVVVHIVVRCSMVNRDNNGMMSVVMLSSVVSGDDNSSMVDWGSGMMSIMVLIMMSDSGMMGNGGVMGSSCVMNWCTNVMGLHG